MKKINSLLLLFIALSSQGYTSASELEIIDYSTLDPKPVLMFEGAYHEAKVYPVLPLLEKRNIINVSVENIEEFTYQRAPDIFNVPANTTFIIRLMLSSPNQIDQVSVGKIMRVPNDNLVFTITKKQTATFGEILNDFISKKHVNREKKDDIDLRATPKPTDWFAAFKAAPRP